MKKITLLLSFVACVVFAQAQTNLLANPSFETWAAGLPTGWIVPATPAHAVSITVTQEQTPVLVSNGASSFKVVTDANNNPAYQQIIPITPGKTYTLSIDYYIVSGDGTDARIWSNFKNGSVFLTDAVLTTAGILEKLKGPGGTSSYFPDEKGAWKTYTTEFVAPVGATDFDFEFRTYKTTTVIWDNMFFGEKTGTGFSNATANTTKFTLKGRTMESKSIANGTVVEVFTALGTKVQTAVLVNGLVRLNDLTKGLYIVRAGKYTQKIML